jgi:RHS repeat-associated protein
VNFYHKKLKISSVLMVLLVYCLLPVNAAVPVTLQSPSYYAQTDPFLETVTSADLNGDKHYDIVAVNGKSNSLSVLLANTNGTFNPKIDYATGTWPRNVLFGDFNRDGALDLVTFNNCTPGAVSILLNKGDGTFLPRVDYPTIPTAAIADIMDYNHDGILDIIMVFNNFAVLLGNGDGTFRPFQIVSMFGTILEQVKFGDFNNDGITDIVTKERNRYPLYIYFGNSDGTYRSSIMYNPGVQSWRYLFGDFNNDGNTDIVTMNYNIFCVSVILGNGNGTFLPRVDYPTVNRSNSITIGDLNNDGYIDIAATRENLYPIAFFINNGDGTFMPRQEIRPTYGPRNVTVGDFNADGKLDVAVGSCDGVNLRIGVLLNTTTRGKGDEVNNVVTGTTFYSDSYGVFEKNGVSPVNLAYTTLSSDGREMYTDGVSNGARQFYVKDHLGSTRMVIDNQNAIVEATAYQAYGTKEDLVINADKKVRDKFTGKEYDNEGVNYAQLEVDFTFNFITNPSELTASHVLFMFADAQNDLVSAKVQNIDGKYVIRQTYNFTQEEGFYRLMFMFPSLNVINLYRDIYATTLQVGKKTRIAATFNSVDELGTAGFSITTTDIENTGSGLVYFGARYYDAEVGVWSSCDPAGQFYNPYQYATNPVSFVDPDGRFFSTIASAASWYINTSISQGSLNPTKWNWDDPYLIMNIALSSIGIMNSLSNDLERFQIKRYESKTRVALTKEIARSLPTLDESVSDAEKTIFFYYSDDEIMKDEKPGRNAFKKIVEKKGYEVTVHRNATNESVKLGWKNNNSYGISVSSHGTWDRAGLKLAKGTYLFPSDLQSTSKGSNIKFFIAGACQQAKPEFYKLWTDAIGTDVVFVGWETNMNYNNMNSFFKGSRNDGTYMSRDQILNVLP